MTLRNLRRTIATTAGAVLLASAVPALAAAPAQTVAKVPYFPTKAPKLVPKRTKKQRLMLARKHVRKTVAEPQVGDPMILSPLDRYIDDDTTMELAGVNLPIPNEEYAQINAPFDPSMYPIMFRWHSETSSTYLVDCILSGVESFDVITIHADPSDYLLEYSVQIFSATITLQDKNHITFAVRPAANKNVMTFVRSTAKQYFSMQRCEITPIAD